MCSVWVCLFHYLCHLKASVTMLPALDIANVLFAFLLTKLSVIADNCKRAAKLQKAQGCLKTAVGRIASP